MLVTGGKEERVEAAGLKFIEVPVGRGAILVH